MEEFEFLARDESDTDRLGAALAAALPAGTTVALIGTLGAGKTRLVQAFAAACGVPREEATSPTFVLVNQYYGQRPIYHIDVYRVRDEDEFLELGPDEYFESDGVTFVEWADRVSACLPEDRLEIHCEAVSQTERRFNVRTSAPRLFPALRQMAMALGV